MRSLPDKYSKGVDLLSVILTCLVISCFSYITLKDSETGKIRDLKILIASLVLHWTSYLLPYLILLIREHYFKMPRWVLIAFFGSLFCAATFRLPIYDLYFEEVVLGLVFFGGIALVIMGSVRLLSWILVGHLMPAAGLLDPVRDG